MPRINIEDELFDDPYFHVLVEIVGCEYKAIGILVKFWRYAIRPWCDEKKGVAAQIFERIPEFKHLSDVGFAQKIDNEYVARGANKHFAWLMHKKEAGRAGGKKSAELRASKSKHRSSKSKHCSSTAQADVKQTSSKSNPLTLTLTPTLTQGSKEPISSAVPKYSADDLALAREWIGALKIGKSSPNYESAAETIRKLRQIDGYSMEELKTVFEFVKGDEFWRDQARSPYGLRNKSKSNGLPKIENILARMRTGNFKTEEQKQREYQEEMDRLYPRLD
jgi:hypothetical protein